MTPSNPSWLLLRFPGPVWAKPLLLMVLLLPIAPGPNAVYVEASHPSDNTRDWDPGDPNACRAPLSGIGSVLPTQPPPGVPCLKTVQQPHLPFSVFLYHLLY